MKLITVCFLVSFPQIIICNKCDHFCGSIPHTECFPAGGGDDCKNNEKVYLNTDEKREILNFHNGKRNDVAKALQGGLKIKSSNMVKLQWNGEIGLYAKRWADQCKEGQHDQCRTTRDGVETGQNSYIGIYKKTKSTRDKKVQDRFHRIQMMLRTWFSEIELVKVTDIKHFDKTRTAAIGNVTQMIWAETMYIGCGYTEFTLKDGYLLYRFVCDYEPSGNIHSKPVFLEGKICTKCPKGFSCSDTFIYLCKADNESKNVFSDESKAHISNPAFYMISIFAFIALLRSLRYPVDKQLQLN